jgi:hypothetical protein
MLIGLQCSVLFAILLSSQRISIKIRYICKVAKNSFRKYVYFSLEYIFLLLYLYNRVVLSVLQKGFPMPHITAACRTV